MKMKYYFFSLIIFLNVIAVTAAVAQGPTSENVDAVTAAVAQGPTSENVDELLAEAALLSQLERYEEALPFFDRALEIEPEHVDALKAKGIILIFMERYEEASLILDKAVELAPEDRDALNFKSTALAALGKSREAGEYLLRIAKIEEKINSIVLSGIEHYNKKEFDESLSYFDSALELDPENVDALNGKALILFEREIFVEAIGLIQKAAKLAPDSPLIQKNLLAILLHFPADSHPAGSLKILVRDTNGGLIGYQEVSGFNIFQNNVTDVLQDEFEFKKVIQREGQDFEVSQFVVKLQIPQSRTFFQSYIIMQVNNTEIPALVTLNHGMPLLKGETLTELWTMIMPVG